MKLCCCTTNCHVKPSPLQLGILEMFAFLSSSFVTVGASELRFCWSESIWAPM